MSDPISEPTKKHKKGSKESEMTEEPRVTLLVLLKSWANTPPSMKLSTLTKPMQSLACIRARGFEALGMVSHIPGCGDFETGGKVGITKEVKLHCIKSSGLE